MAIVQFTRFRVAAHRETALLETRHVSLRACRGTEPELRHAYLIRLEGDEWLDIAVWAGQPGAVVFDAALPASRSDFFGQIDELLGEECGILVHEQAGPADGAGGDAPSA